MRFLVTVDDFSHFVPLAQQQRALDFLEGQGVRASLFAVPRAGEKWRADRDEQWRAFARAAAESGHDFQLHGLDHAAYEFGPTPDWMMALGGKDEGERFSQARAERGANWRTEVFVAMLRLARDIFASALGKEPLVFRSGALSQCPALYEALPEVGLRYASNKVADLRGWKYIVGEYDNPGDWDPEVPASPYRLSERVVNVPIISEYAWYVPPDRLDRHVALAAEDLGRVQQAGGVFTPVCHAQCVGAEEDYARRILSQILAIARQEYAAEFLTLTELVGQVEAREVAVLPCPRSPEVSDDAH